MMRFDLLVLAVALVLWNLCMSFPLTLDASAWYSGYGVLAVFAAIVFYAFRKALGRQATPPRLFTPQRLIFSNECAVQPEAISPVGTPISRTSAFVL